MKKLKTNVGFSADRSCDDHIFVIREILEKQRDKGKRKELKCVDLGETYIGVMNYCSYCSQ